MWIDTSQDLLPWDKETVKKTGRLLVSLEQILIDNVEFEFAKPQFLTNHGFTFDAAFGRNLIDCQSSICYIKNYIASCLQCPLKSVVPSVYMIIYKKNRLRQLRSGK